MRCLISLVISSFITSSYCHVCTLDSGLTSTWKSSNYGTITITSTTITLGKHTFVVNSKTTNTAFECHFSSGLTYVVQSVDTLSALGDTGHLYMCLAFTRLNDNSYYFYMHSPTNHLFGNDRVVFWAETAAAPTFSDICSETSPAAVFNSIVKEGSEHNAKVNCMSLFFNNFYYDRTTSSGASSNCVSSGSNPLKVCDDKQTMKFNTTECSSPILFSKNGNLACVTVIQSGSTYFVSLYNEDADSDINGLTTFRFTCIVSRTSSTGEVQLTAKPNRCDETQTTTARPTNGELLLLTSYYSCATVEENDSSSVVGLAVGLTLLFIFIIVIIVIIVWYCMKRRERNKLQDKIKQNISSFKTRLKIKEADDKHPLSETSLFAESHPKETSKRKKRAPSSVGEVIFPSYSKGSNYRGKNKYTESDKGSVRWSADTLQSDLYMQRSSTSLNVLPSRQRSGRYGRHARHEQSLPDLAEYTTPSNSRPLSRVSGVYDMSAPSTRMFNLRKSMSLEAMQKRTKEEKYSELKRFQSDSKINESHQKYYNYPIQKRKLNRNSDSSNVAKPSILRQTNEKLKMNTTKETTYKNMKPYVTLPGYFRPQRQDSFVKPLVKKGHERSIIVIGDPNKITESMIQKKYPVNSRRPRRKKENNWKDNLWNSPYKLKPKVNEFVGRKPAKFMKAPKVEPYAPHQLNLDRKDTYESRRFANSDYYVLNESDDEDVFIDDRARYSSNLQNSLNRQQNDWHYKRSKKWHNEDSGVSVGGSMSSEDAIYPIPDIMTGF